MIMIEREVSPAVATAGLLALARTLVERRDLGVEPGRTAQDLAEVLGAIGILAGVEILDPDGTGVQDIRAEKDPLRGGRRTGIGFVVPDGAGWRASLLLPADTAGIRRIRRSTVCYSSELQAAAMVAAAYYAALAGAPLPLPERWRPVGGPGARKEG